MGSDHAPFLLTILHFPVFCPSKRPPFFNFQKARRSDFAFYFDFHCPSAEEYSYLSSAAALFTSLTLNAAKSSILFGRIKRHPKVWWCAEVEETVRERRKAFAAAHRSHEDPQAYISASQRASSVITKAKAEAWQATCSSLLPKFNPKSVYSLLRSVAGSSSSSSSSPNFPNYFSLRESASVFADYLRSHFSVSQSKAMRSRARGYISELHRATCPVESHSSFCSHCSPAEFLAAASDLSLFTATGPGPKYLFYAKAPFSLWHGFLLHIFNLSGNLHSFSSIWKTSSIIPIYKMRKPLDSPASFQPISLTSCVSKLFERIILSRLLFFLESNSILSLRQAGFHSGQSTLYQILFLSQSISDGLNKSRPGSRTILSTIGFSKAFNSVWHPVLFYKLISAGLPLCFALLVGFNLFFLTGALAWYQSHKSRFFRVRPGVAQETILGPLLFSHFINDLAASLPSSISCSLYAGNLAVWSSSPSVPTAVGTSQGALFRLERWFKYWCLILNPSKFKAFFFSVDPHQANLQPNLLLLNSRLRFNLFWSHLRPHSFLFETCIFAEGQVFPLFQVLTLYLCFLMRTPSKESLSLLYKSFLSPFSHMLHPDCFLSLALPILPKLERLDRAATRASPAASRSPLSHLFSPRLFYLPYESP